MLPAPAHATSIPHARSSVSCSPSGLSRRGFLSAMAVAAGGLGLGGLPGQALAATGQSAQPALGTAASLRAMFGVVAITSTTRGVWGQRAALTARMQELGTTTIRDRLFVGNNGQLDFLRQLRDAGIRANLIMGVPTGPGGSPEQLVSLAAGQLPGVVRSFEGANEWNLVGGPDWVPELRGHQARLYRAVQADLRVADIPVLGPALGRREGFAALGDLSAHLDRGNLHLYPGGFPPSNRLDEQLANARLVSGDKPVEFSECGYHNASNSPATHFYTPEDVAAVYAPRLLLEHYLRGVRQSFLYQLVDRAPNPGMNDHEQHFGLLRNDLSRKPAFTALSNMMRLLDEPSAADTSPGWLTCGLEPAPSDLRQVLVQRADGSFVLFLWRDVSVYDPRNRRRLSVPSINVTLRLASPHHVRTFRPSSGSGAFRTSTATTSESVSLAGQVVALEITPA